MSKKMFNKFTSLLQNAVESFVPNLTLQEEFIHHWNAVTHYFVDNKEERRRIDETTIPGHIEQMVLILVQEEREQLEPGTTGPCLEYLLHHKLLDTLYTLGRTDHPPGMKQVILVFFTKLLSRIEHPLLPHINVHRAVQRLVKTCGEVRAGPTEKEEIEYLCTVCSKIKADPHLVNFFIEPNKSSKKSSHPKPSNTSQQKTLDFSLVKALLILSSSNDARVCVKACEGIMLCASLPEQTSADCIVRQTSFCDILIDRLCELYDKLPPVVSPSDVESVDAKWGLDAVVTVKEDQQTFKGKWQLTSFLAWLDYCDQLIGISHPTVAAALATTITDKLLIQKLHKDLLQPSESGVIMATAYFTKCLKLVCSPPLLIEFSHFLLGTKQEVELPGEEQPVIRKRLLERCDHLSDEVSIVTMRLFETLLHKEDESIYHNLILRNLIGRCYLNESSGTSSYTSANRNNSSLVPSSATDSDKLIKIVDSLTDESQNKSSTDSNNSVLTDKKAGNSSVSKLQYSESTSEKGDEPDNSNPSNMEAAAEGNPTSEGSASEIQNKISSLSAAETKKSNSTSQKPNTPTQEATPDSTESDTKQLKSDSNSMVTESDLKTREDTPTSTKESSPSTVSTSPRSSESPETSDRLHDTERLLDTIENSDLLSPSDSHVPGSQEIPEYRPFKRSEVHKIVTSFLSLLPEEAKSSYQTADSGYDMYLKDAHKQFSAVEQVCKAWNWPKEPVRNPDFKLEPFWEGSFLKMLLDKLSRILNQSYGVNLLVTSLISRLVLLPHANIQEYLLDPFLPTVSTTRTLYSVLKKVSAEVLVYMKREGDFQNKLGAARKYLLGDVESLTSLRLQPASSPSPGHEDQGQLEAIIVLEEFCKELSAITFVKYHAEVTRS